MTHENMTERQAYAKATAEFYEIRAQQEEEERKAKEKMNNALNNLQSKRKWTERGIYLEERALREGQIADAQF
jgi:small subunit ribosomal protein S23